MSPGSSCSFAAIEILSPLRASRRGVTGSHAPSKAVLNACSLIRSLRSLAA